MKKIFYFFRLFFFQVKTLEFFRQVQQKARCAPKVALKKSSKDDTRDKSTTLKVPRDARDARDARDVRGAIGARDPRDARDSRYAKEAI